MQTLLWYWDKKISTIPIGSSPDEYRGDLCMSLRDDFGRGDLADEVGGWSDERIIEDFDGARPYDAAWGLVNRNS
jgi:hypothetical protein